MSKKTPTSFINSQGQSVSIPFPLADKAYLEVANLASIYQNVLTDMTAGVEVEFASGRRLKPRITGVLPALTEIAALVLVHNTGKYDKGELVTITVNDLLKMFDVLRIGSLVNPSTFKQAWSNVTNRTRDRFSRQISLPVYRVLGDAKIRHTAVQSDGQGRPAFGYYVE